MKWVLRILIGVLVLVVVVLAIGWFYLDTIVKEGVERGGTYALDVKTTLGGASVSLLGGTLELNDLTVANPEGYNSDHAMEMGKFDLAVDRGSLLSNTIHVKEFKIDKIDMNLEKKLLGETNIQKLLDNLERLGGGGGGEAAPPEEKKEGQGGKKLKIDRVEISGIVAHVNLASEGGQMTTLTIEPEPIVLKNLGSDSDQGLLVSEVVKVIFPAIVVAVVKKGGDALPTDMASNLMAGANGVLNQLGGLTIETLGGGQKLLETGLKDLGEGMGKTVEGAGEQMHKATEGAGEGVKKIGEGLKGILNGGKKEEGQ